MKNVLMGILFAFSAAGTAAADPYLAQSTNVGTSGGNTYFEEDFGLDSGKTCYNTSGGEFVSPYNGSGPNVSYAGVSGFSVNYCQVNLYASTGSGYYSKSYRWNVDGGAPKTCSTDNDCPGEGSGSCFYDNTVYPAATLCHIMTSNIGPF